MADAAGLLSWNLDELARALKISPEAVRLYFTDGRRISFILERRLAQEVLSGTLAPSEGAGYDLLDPQGGKWEVRTISMGGPYFCPSYMVGSGRRFAEAGFLTKLEAIKGYILADITSFPDVPFWIVTSDTVLDWWRRGLLGTSTKISRAGTLNLLRELP